MAALASEYLSEILEPEKFAAAIFGVTLTFTILSTNAVGFRTWMRLRRKQLGNDDYLMCAAMMVNLVQNALVMHGTFVGIGSPDSKLNSEIEQEGREYLFLWQIFYAISLVFIKTSILTTLKRVDTKRRFIYAIWGLIALVIVLCVAVIITLLAKCRPIQANWTGNGTCMDSDIFVALAKTGYALDVVTDLAMAVISTMLLWGPELSVTSKVTTGLALGLGAIAAIASVVRTVYTDAYSSDDNYLYSTGKIVLWTVVECSLGIIAGSLPMLRPAQRSRAHDEKIEELEMNRSDADFRIAVAEAAGTVHQHCGGPRSP
ncbi:hypothetical protein BD289DRAFT_369632 [Coniella lustricola]|uniref:Rhodopsin domain-containing protein n=1 Tax=Coniella lustricola TaxID=2025994 RepID=A0A2T3A6B0_9PEZI|nr:hypothetical protein BD289DRAFT_369632 [Coniella lustricola]